MSPKLHSQYQLEEPSHATVFSFASIIERDIDNNFTNAIQCGRKSRGFHTGGSWERYSPILMKSGRAAAWAARSASSSSSHLAAISGSGSPRRLPRPPSPPPPPSPAALPSPSFFSFPLSGLFLSSFSQGNLRHWKTRLDSEFIKMHTASLRIRPEYLPSFTRELCFESTATLLIADMKSAMIIALREPKTNGRAGSSNNNL